MIVASSGNGIIVGGKAGSGTLSSVTVSNFTGGITNSGLIVAEAGAGIVFGGIAGGGIATGGSVTIANFAGGISNSGTIEANLIGILVGGAAFTNGSVTISAFSGGISNSGTIEAGLAGILVGNFTGFGTVTIATFSGGITNSGTISAGRTGIFVANVETFSGNIGNSGTISAARAGIVVTSVVQFGSASAGGGISNSGTIIAGHDGTGIDVLNVSTFMGGISNSGTISVGIGGAGIVVGATHFYGNVSNSGTIVGGHTGIYICDCATFAGGAIVNSGIISANANAIFAADATSPVIIDQVAGTITGAIRLSAYADQLNISGGAINGNIVGQGSLDTINFALGAGNTFTYAAAYGFSGINLVNINSGTVVLNGLNSATTVDVNGGTLAGTGTLDPAVTIFSGGTLAPGTPGGLGTLNIIGSLTFDAGSFYAIRIEPGAGNNSLTALTGTANLGGNGTVEVTPQLGHYAATVYQILTTTGPLTGAFGNLTVTGDFTGTMSLDYATNSPDDVDLDVSAGFSLLTAPPGASPNQQSLVNGLNNAILGGDNLPPGFVNLGNLSGPVLLNALTQLDGETATGAQTSAFQLMTDFVNLMLDPSAGGGGTTGGTAPGFTDEEQGSLPPDVALAYAAVLKKPPPQQSFDQRWSAWGSGFGGASKTDGNAAAGSNNVTASDYGFAGGMDYRVTPQTDYGFALAGGGTTWSLAQGLGGGRGNSFQVGVYATTHWGPAYVSGALAFANHWFTTNRIALGDQLTANFDGQSYVARVEGGYRYALPVGGAAILGVTPYGAVQAQLFHTPSYSETDLTGGGFGLSYGATNATDTRSELGARFDDLTLLGNTPTVWRARVAWAHDWVSDPSLGAVFQALPGSNFTVNGAAPPANSALTTASAEFLLSANWTLMAKFDGEFASTAQTYAGTGTLRYSW